MLDVLKQFNFISTIYSVEPLGNGLINTTWLIESDSKKFVLQKLNTSIFTNPKSIDFNINLLKNHLQKYHPNYLFVSPLKTSKGITLVKEKNEFYRLFSFVANSKTVSVVTSPKQAFEAAKQFARFTKLASTINVSLLKTTLPNFHNLQLRLHQFNAALANGNKERILECKELIFYLNTQKNILKLFDKRKVNFKVRVIHHDTKISNVLFDNDNNSICVIDLDTIMPGYFISDIGDMMRTYLSPVSEEESDVKKIEIRPDYYNAIVEGYLSELGDELTKVEKQSFHFAGKYMIYMQALRFLTDYLNNDIYYGCAYPKQNFVRATNQCTLLQKLNLFEPLP